MLEGRPDVHVIGNGIIGMACARDLARQGLRVEILDSGPVRKRASLAAAGLLAPLSHAIQPGPAGEACLESRRLWPAWREELAADAALPIEFDDSGALLTAATDEQEGVIAEVLAMADAIDERWQEIDPEVALAQVPDLRPDLRRAVLLPRELRVDNVAVVAALEAACRRDGIALRLGVTVLSVERSGDGLVLHTDEGTIATPRAVLAAGCWASKIEGCGPFAIRPVRGQMIRFDGAHWPWSSMVRVGDYYAVRRGADRVLFGATVEEAGFDDRITHDGIDRLTHAFREAFPGLADRPRAAAWSGLRPASGDGRPVVGPWRDWPLFVAAGHHRDGILLAPWTARCAAAWAADAGWRPAPELAPDRFAADPVATGVRGSV